MFCHGLAHEERQAIKIGLLKMDICIMVTTDGMNEKKKNGDDRWHERAEAVRVSIRLFVHSEIEDVLCREHGKGWSTF